MEETKIAEELEEIKQALIGLSDGLKLLLYHVFGDADDGEDSDDMQVKKPKEQASITNNYNTQSKYRGYFG